MWLKFWRLFRMKFYNLQHVISLYISWIKTHALFQNLWMSLPPYILRNPDETQGEGGHGATWWGDLNLSQGNNNNNPHNQCKGIYTFWFNNVASRMHNRFVKTNLVIPVIITCVTLHMDNLYIHDLDCIVGLSMAPIHPPYPMRGLSN